MRDLTEQEIVDAIDRALARVEQRFAASRSKPGTSAAKGRTKKPASARKSKKELVAAE